MVESMFKFYVKVIPLRVNLYQVMYCLRPSILDHLIEEDMICCVLHSFLLQSLHMFLASSHLPTQYTSSAQLSNKLFFWRHIKFFNEAYFVATYIYPHQKLVCNQSFHSIELHSSKAYNWDPKEENEVTFVD